MTAPRPWSLLHLTPHLGGGVGRALVGLAEADRRWPRQAPQRTVLCLEAPEKTGAVARLGALGVTVLTLRDGSQLPALVRSHDIVQCEFWNHPLTFEALARIGHTPARLLFWCHVSGLHFPRLPAALWQQPFPVVLSAACSLRSADPGLQQAVARGQAQVISSAAGFEHWPQAERTAPQDGALRLGYLGSLNEAKMHPQYVDWLAAATPAGAQIEVLGDETHPGVLAQRCRELGRPDLMRLPGFCHDVPRALARWDAMPYLLNPHHYGTAELALLEAMASGVVPVVGDQPCETEIVRDGDTGCVVRSPAELAHTLRDLAADPAQRARIAQRASECVRDTFTSERQTSAFRALHSQMMDQPRQSVDWLARVGAQPWQRFLSTVPDRLSYRPGRRPQLPLGTARHAHLEYTKGSVHHFARCHPHDAQLQAWSRAIAPVLQPELAAA